MKNYKHYSFDLWKTLIRPNEKFEELFASHVYNCYASSYYTLKKIREIIDYIQLHGIAYCELTGKHMDSSVMMYMLFREICWIPVGKDLENIQFHYNKLFLENPPYLYDNYTKHVLNTLKERGCILNILSNTGFISSKYLDIVLKKLEVLDYFDFTMYSDEYGFAKPNKEFFDIMYLESLNRVGNLESLGLNEIIHVGDNPIADGGSVQIGIEFFQINTNNNTILDLL